MSEFFIRRPIVAIVIAVFMVLIGAICIITLPIAQYPNIVPPEIQIQTHYTGADALTIEQSVAAPIEQKMSGVDKMNYMYSINANNGDMRMFGELRCRDRPNIDQILTQLRVSQAQSQLPQDVNDFGVTTSEVGRFAADGSLLSLRRTQTYDKIFLANYAYINLVDQLIASAGHRHRAGIRRRPVRHAAVGQARPARQAGHHRAGHHRRGAEAKQRQSRGPDRRRAYSEGQKFTYTVRAQGRLSTPEEFGNIVVRANPDGSLVRVKDVARIELGAQTYNLESRLNGQPAAAIGLYQLPGSNAVEASKAVREFMEEAKQRFPADMDYAVSLDQTDSVREGMREIVQTLVEAIALVVVVVFIFLQGWRATIIPLCAVPVSLIGTFVLFPLFGFSINTLSLFGLVLAIGLVVDDAIVVVEAVEHHIEQGMSPREATRQAMREVSGPVIGVACVLSAVFIPTVFLPGITGKLYQQFALTIAISVIISAFNALSLSPALSALAASSAQGSAWAARLVLPWLQSRLQPPNEWLCQLVAPGDPEKRAKPRVTRCLLCRRGLVRQKATQSFLPEEDQGYIYMALQLPDASSLERTDEAARKIEEVRQQDAGREIHDHRRRLQPA